MEPYNSILASHSLAEHMNAVVLFDNVSVYDICRHYLDIERPTYANLNQLVSQAISSMTASMRFDEPAFNPNLMAFSRSTHFGRLHFLASLYAPVMSTKKVQHEQLSFVQITNAAFEPSSYMVKCDPRNGRYMRCFTIYRGDDVDFKDVKDAVSIAKEKIAFDPDDDKESYRCGINYTCP